MKHRAREPNNNGYSCPVINNGYGKARVFASKKALQTAIFAGI